MWASTPLVESPSHYLGVPPFHLLLSLMIANHFLIGARVNQRSHLEIVGDLPLGNIPLLLIDGERHAAIFVIRKSDSSSCIGRWAVH